MEREEALSRLAELRAASAELGEDMAALQEEVVGAARAMQEDLQSLIALVAGQGGGLPQTPTMTHTLGDGIAALGPMPGLHELQNAPVSPPGEDQGQDLPVPSAQDLDLAVNSTVDNLLAQGQPVTKARVLEDLRTTYTVSEKRVKAALKQVRTERGLQS